VSEELDFPSAATYRVPRRRGMDPGTKRLAIIAAGLGAALVAIVGVWSVGERHGGGRIPVIEADNRPIRVKPDNPGGLQFSGTNDEILSGDSGPQNGKLAPPPETPEPQALRAQETPPPKAENGPASSAAPPAAPSPPVPARVAPLTAEAPHASAAPPPARAVEAAKAEAPRKEAASHPASSFGHATAVQLAAVGSEEAAKAEWERLAKKMPDLLNGRRPAMVKSERDGRAFWRLRTGGFNDIAQATAFCERVRAKGGGCSIASF
jgi:SPOR domain